MNMEQRLRERQDYFFALSLFHYWIILKDKTRREQNQGGNSTFRTRNYLEFIHIQQSWRAKAISIGFVDGTFKGKLAKVT